jgi:hypothetical protein
LDQEALGRLLLRVEAEVLGQPMPEVDNVPSLWDWDSELAKAVEE